MNGREREEVEFERSPSCGQITSKFRFVFFVCLRKRRDLEERATLFELYIWLAVNTYTVYIRIYADMARSGATTVSRRQRSS